MSCFQAAVLNPLATLFSQELWILFGIRNRLSVGCDGQLNEFRDRFWNFSQLQGLPKPPFEEMAHGVV